MYIPHADFTTEPLSLSEFQGRFPEAELELPASATRIFYAQSNVGLRGFTRMYRFDAPSPDCIAYPPMRITRCSRSISLRIARSSAFGWK